MALYVFVVVLLLRAQVGEPHSLPVVRAPDASVSLDDVVPGSPGVATAVWSQQVRGGGPGGGHTYVEPAGEECVQVCVGCVWGGGRGGGVYVTYSAVEKQWEAFAI